VTRRFRNALAVSAVLLGALGTSIAFSAPAQADPFDCLRYLADQSGTPPLTPEMERACNEAFFGGEEGLRTCVSILRTEGFTSFIPFEACRRGAPSS
jgi:hypothetical protein